MTIYQVLTRLWGEGRFDSFDEASFDYFKSIGVDAVWYTGVVRHACGKPFVKGDPGSPYSIYDYKDVNPYLAEKEEARLDDFKSLISRTHAAGLKAFIDFVPNHVSPDNVNGIPVTGSCDFDWTDTVKIDYGNPGTLAVLAGILRFWVELGVDGFRCDMVELVPVDAMSYLISSLKADYPDLTFIAEVYEKDSYARYVEAGFDLLYDKSGLYDSLRNIICNGLSARAITWNWQRLGPLQGRMLNFLENHDERRLASHAFAAEARKGYAAAAVSALFNDASMMVYFGQEAGEDATESEDGRTSIFNWCRPATVGRLYNEIHGIESLLEDEREVLSRYREILNAAASSPFRNGANYDLCYMQEEGFDQDRHFAFLRYDAERTALVVCNFSDRDGTILTRLPEQFGGGSTEVAVKAFDYIIKYLK